MQAGNQLYQGPVDIPEIMPVFPLEGALLLPRGQMPLNIFEPRYLAMIDDALAGDRVIGMIQPRDAGASALCDIGCAGRIISFGETGDGRYLITLTGIARFRVIAKPPSGPPYPPCRVSSAAYAHDFVERAGEDAVDTTSLLRALSDFLDAN